MLEQFLNLEFFPLGINRRRFMMPAAPLQTQYNDADITPCADDCALQPGGCWCTHIVTVPYNQTVQVRQLACFAYYPADITVGRYSVIDAALEVVEK